jgi:hypothetical protein
VAKSIENEKLGIKISIIEGGGKSAICNPGHIMIGTP